MWIYGFAQVKVKVGVPGQDDPARLGRIRRVIGGRMDLRIDANEAWSAAEVVDRVAPLRQFRPTALEQPVPHAEVDALAGLRREIGVPIMLDESLCGYPDAVRAVELGTADVLNVRLSKCGGILPSLRIMALARREGLDVQLGCHPGETGILSAAGRQVACRVRAIRYLEVATKNWWPGKHVLLSPGWVEKVSWEELKVYVGVTREAIQSCEEYTDRMAITREYENKLYFHYGRPPYWIE